MSHVSVIVVGGVGDNDSIHVIDSSLATTSQNQHDTPSINQVIERSYSSASHSSNTSSIGTGLSISSGSHSAPLNSKHYPNSREMKEPSAEQFLPRENDENIDNRGPSQNSLRVEGTTIDETEEDMIEESSSYNQYHQYVSNRSDDHTRPVREDSEGDSGVIEESPLGKKSDAIVPELPDDSPIKVKSDVSIDQF